MYSIQLYAVPDRLLSAGVARRSAGSIAPAPLFHQRKIAYAKRIPRIDTGSRVGLDAAKHQSGRCDTNAVLVSFDQPLINSDQEGNHEQNQFEDCCRML